MGGGRIRLPTLYFFSPLLLFRFFWTEFFLSKMSNNSNFDQKVWHFNFRFLVEIFASSFPKNKPLICRLVRLATGKLFETHALKQISEKTDFNSSTTYALYTELKIDDHIRKAALTPVWSKFLQLLCHY